MYNVIYKTKNFFSSLISFWNELPTGGKWFWGIVFGVFIFPQLFIWTIYHTLYLPPFQKYFDVADRQMLTIKENKMILTNFYLCNSKEYKVFTNSTKNNYGNNMCSEEITVKENVVSDGLYPPQNYSTAIVGNNKIVWADNTEKENYTINIYEVSKTENNEYKINTKVLKTFKKFDLGTYADNLKKGKPTPSLSTIYSQTGHIWNKPFLVEGEDVIFYDAMVSKVDGEKPVEAVSRKFTVNVGTGSVKSQVSHTH